jgi:predicted GNAT family acetyltransferase
MNKMTDVNAQEGLTLRNNTQEQRFEAQAGDSIAVAEYRLNDNVITFTHTEVPKAMEGRGVAGQLIKRALDESRARHYQVIPSCPFVAGLHSAAH